MNDVSFKGLYVLTGNPKNARTKHGETISEIRMSKLDGFLQDTKSYRKEQGVSYYNEHNGDYYMEVKPECEAFFEDSVQDFHLDCVKVGSDAVPNNENAKKEVNFIKEKLFAIKRYLFKDYEKNIILKENLTYPPIKKEINIPKH